MRLSKTLKKGAFALIAVTGLARAATTVSAPVAANAQTYDGYGSPAMGGRFDSDFGGGFPGGDRDFSGNTDHFGSGGDSRLGFGGRNWDDRREGYGRRSWPTGYYGYPYYHGCDYDDYHIYGYC